jgi:Mitochondrial ribosomal subunit protein
MRSLRPVLPRCLQPCSRFPRHLHTTPSLLADSNFTDDAVDTTFEDFSSSSTGLSSGSTNSSQGDISDQLAYAKQVNERGMRRWQESQEPKGNLQFMTMGREFTVPYNLTQLSYMSLNHMRELRAYYRKIMYEMPQFTSTTPRLFLGVILTMVEFHRTFRPPTKFEVLRFRYTSYLGENHPAGKKVVLMVQVKHLRAALASDSRIDDAWEHKLKLLCGPRYHPDTDTIHMSCEQFQYPAQNKRWLSDKMDELIQAAAVLPSGS